ncbi:hypothetical protein FO519_006832 [Halicephalobus sp. NKZ332]|nr:hypothetical protein FO519_006832 [Halicephalobus sp. NKZ332]
MITVFQKNSNFASVFAGSKMNSTVYSLLLCALAALVLSQELTDDTTSQMDKRYRSFAFAKRFAFNGPSRSFAFAKRSPMEEDSDDLAEKRARFAFAKRSLRPFAFAKRAYPSAFA